MSSTGGDVWFSGVYLGWGFNSNVTQKNFTNSYGLVTNSSLPFKPRKAGILKRCLVSGLFSGDGASTAVLHEELSQGAVEREYRDKYPVVIHNLCSPEKSGGQVAPYGRERNMEDIGCSSFLMIHLNVVISRAQLYWQYGTFGVAGIGLWQPCENNNLYKESGLNQDVVLPESSSQHFGCIRSLWCSF
ncbi:hypothetical protein Ancab_035473 [Ancistrocladus abbreviatus]